MVTILVITALVYKVKYLRQIQDPRGGNKHIPSGFATLPCSAQLSCHHHLMPTKRAQAKLEFTDIEVCRSCA